VDLRERRIAGIVRDFMQAYERSGKVGDRLESGTLEFKDVESLVGEGEEATLFRLKEECHALFRLDTANAREDLLAEELFDLAVGALFHEAMKFREGYYVTTTYGPRLERLMAAGGAPGPLVSAFRRLFDAGRRRMLESQAETRELFRETRDQLVVMLRQLPESGALARALVEDPARTERVFGASLDALLAGIYGSAERGRRLAVQSLVEGGHYAEAAELLEACESVRARGSGAGAFARGMARYYGGDLVGAVDDLASWIGSGLAGDARWRPHARRALSALAADGEAPDSTLARRARELLGSL
jgi:hypothetical protein